MWSVERWLEDGLSAQYMLLTNLKILDVDVDFFAWRTPRRIYCKRVTVKTLEFARMLLKSHPNLDMVVRRVEPHDYYFHLSLVCKDYKFKPIVYSYPYRTPQQLLVADA